MDTIEAGRFEDTNKIFERPEVLDKKITRHLSDDEIRELAEVIKGEL